MVFWVAGRIQDDLHDEGERCGLNRVARLMRLDGLQGIPCKKKLRSKSSGTRPSDVENHLARDFSADAPNTKCFSFIAAPAPRATRSNDNGIESRMFRPVQPAYPEPVPISRTRPSRSEPSEIKTQYGAGLTRNQYNYAG